MKFKCNKFDVPLVVQNGDRIQLTVDGELVHAVDLTGFDLITCWACVQLPGVGIGYFVGNNELPAALKKLFGGQHGQNAS